MENRKWWQAGLLGCAAACLTLVPACRGTEAPEKPEVVCSLFPLYEFARAVAGERADVSLLLPPGVEPHAWEPKASDLVAISKADLFLCVSQDLEPWAGDVVRGAARKGLKVMVATEGLDMIEQGHPARHGEEGSRGRDPHVWLDLQLDQRIVARIAEALSAIDPAGEAYYRANAREYSEKLHVMDERYKETLARCRQRYLIVGGHSAFAYLARRYGLEQIPLYGVSADSEPTPQRLAEVIETARAAKVKHIFFETLINPRLSRVVAEEIGAGTLVLNPGANLTAKEFAGGATFLSILGENLESLKKGLECEG
jgi:zinc transport system substrate-binding protein